MNDGDSWGTSQEKGLNAAFCVFTIIGIGTDWLLRRRLGECPDEVRIHSTSHSDSHITFQIEMGPIFGKIHDVPPK